MSCVRLAFNARRRYGTLVRRSPRSAPSLVRGLLASPRRRRLPAARGRFSPCDDEPRLSEIILKAKSILDSCCQLRFDGDPCINVRESFIII